MSTIDYVLVAIVGACAVLAVIGLLMPNKEDRAD
jgi:uncharacterized membrane protein YeaQ/YmgE (transglycosylase-associated protein family)